MSKDQPQKTIAELYEQDLKDTVTRERDVLEQYASKMVSDPLMTLDGCERAFTAGARVSVYQEIVDALEMARSKGETILSKLTFLVGSYENDIFSTARHPRRSTDLTSNLFHQALLAARADAVDKLRFMILGIEKEQVDNKAFEKAGGAPAAR